MFSSKHIYLLEQKQCITEPMEQNNNSVAYAFILYQKNAAIAIYLSLKNPNEASYIAVDANNFFCPISISSTT
jgi:hypothetical protein